MASMPRRELLAMNLTTLPVIGLGIVCMFLQVVPARLPWGGNGYLVALMAAAIYAGIQFPIMGWARRWRPLEFPGAWVFAFVIATLFYSLAFWPMIRAGLPWLSATVVGTAHTEQFHMRTEWDRGTRALCHYKLLGGPLPDAPFPGHYLCITRAQYLQAPDSEVHVTLSGLRSSLGMRVTSIDLIDTQADGVGRP